MSTGNPEEAHISSIWVKQEVCDPDGNDPEGDGHSNDYPGGDDDIPPDDGMGDSDDEGVFPALNCEVKISAEGSNDEESGRRLVRSTARQIKVLEAYMAANPCLANGYYKGPWGKVQQNKQWEVLRRILRKHGPDRTVKQWENSWRDLRRKQKNEEYKAVRVNPSRSVKVVPSKCIKAGSNSNTNSLKTPDSLLSILKAKKEARIDEEAKINSNDEASLHNLEPLVEPKLVFELGQSESGDQSQDCLDSLIEKQSFLRDLSSELRRMNNLTENSQLFARRDSGDEQNMMEMPVGFQNGMGENLDTLKSRSRKFFCPHCPYRARYNHVLKCHMAKHDDLKKYVCDICQYSTKYQTSLHRHKTIQHRELQKSGDIKEYKCKNCEYVSFYRYNLRLHNRRRSCLKRKEMQVKDPIGVNLNTGEVIFNKLKGNEEEKNIETIQIKVERIDDDEVNDNADDANDTVDDPISIENNGEIGDEKTAHNDDNDENNEYNNLSQGIMKIVQEIQDRITQPPNQDDSADKPIMYNCSICDYSTKYKSAIKQHAKKHSSLKPYKCDECPYESKYPTSIQRHKIIRHVTKNPNTVILPELFPCDKCDYKTYYKTNLKAHMRKHSTEKPFKCEQCTYATAYRHSFFKHQKMHAPKLNTKTFQCQKCPFSTHHEGRLSWHLLRTHNEPVNNAHKCPHCDFSTKVKWRLTLHVQRSRQENALPCMHCDYESMYKCEVKLHKKSHMGLKSDPLADKPDDTLSYLDENGPELVEDSKESNAEEICIKQENISKEEESFNEANSTNEANNTQEANSTNEANTTNEANSGVIDDMFEYNTSNGLVERVKLYQKKIIAEEHFIMEVNESEWNKVNIIKNVNDEKPFACSHCQYTARFKSSVQRHFQRHHSSSLRPFKCMHCDFATKTKDSIALHTKRSKSLVEMICKCGQFRTFFKCAYGMHEKLHNMYRCSMCTYSCKGKYDLESHYMLHNGAGMKCKYCDYVASRKYSLLCHEAIHTGNKPFKCRFCAYSSVRQGLLENHMKRIHYSNGSTPQNIHLDESMDDGAMDDCNEHLDMEMDESVERDLDVNADRDLDVNSDRDFDVNVDRDFDESAERDLDECKSMDYPGGYEFV